MHMQGIGSVTTAMQQAVLLIIHSTVQFAPLISVLHVHRLVNSTRLEHITIHFFSGKQVGNFIRIVVDNGNVRCAERQALLLGRHLITVAPVTVFIFAAVA